LIKKRNAQFLNESEFLSLSCELATRAGDNDEAASLALRIVRQAKSYTAIKNAIKNAIYTLDKTKRVDEALEVIKAEKQSAIVCLKAEIWAFKNDLNKAEEILEPRVVEQRQIETYIWVEILQRNRQFKKAKEVLYGLYDTDLGKSPVYLKKLVEMQKVSGATNEAIATIDRWKKVAPNDQQAWMAEYAIHMKMKNYSRAISCLRRAIPRFEDSGSFKELLAKVYVKSSQTSEAFNIYWKSFESAFSDYEKLQWIKQLVALSAKSKLIVKLEDLLLERRKNNPSSALSHLALVHL